MSKDRKPAGESWESFADRRIREASEQGEFDKLPGLGQPIPGIDEPLDENWWVRQKLRNEGLSVVPPTIEARRKREQALEKVPSLGSEQAVRRLLEKVNETIREAQFSAAAGPAKGVHPVDIEQVVQQWREQRAEPQQP
ncbi:hypothetical protein Mal4_07010 [Maioricimonas rarisocia]|uniref:DnaJ homologue subfamily C member 28 conserved domain-containing protein n=2 Tax=Maioricimonas rarisocia TaxID=2528026 RepID=A0A517Z1T0_9PLAN|nr:hypothetical protein Mal4_07010 [Maioricimonas rarisocia]